MNSKLLVCAAAGAVVFVLATVTGASWSPEPPEAWEYRVLVSEDLTEGELTSALNSLGREGWELVVSTKVKPDKVQISKISLLLKRAR